jgi:ATP-dependent DNA helicase RecG
MLSWRFDPLPERRSGSLDRAGQRRPDAGSLQRPVAVLKGVGPSIGQRLARLGVHRCGDLLCLLPARYEDRTQLKPLGSLSPGDRVLVEGRLELAEVVFRRRRVLLCRIADGTGALTLRFFHFSPAQQQSLSRGARLRCFGEVRAGPTGLEMTHPEYRLLGERPEPPEATLTPVYPTTEGLHQQRLRALVEQALVMLDREPATDYLAELLPARWPSLSDALKFLHRPPQGAEVGALVSGRHPCQRRLAFEELVAQRLSLKELSSGLQRERALALSDPRNLVPALRSRLPFDLTRAQETALEAIVGDLGKDRPMHRLLQGDVGSGKTVVAAFAALMAASSGYQAAVMAPTELLAEQHLASFSRWLEPLGLSVAALSGSLGAAARRKVLDDVSRGRAQVVVGTHALFQQDVGFRRLALVIVDEQHRFGVHQRLQLKQKGQQETCSPHQLVMTATPIPRTLTMTAYADLDCSVIGELPPGRQPVRTVAMPEQRRALLVQRVLEHCRQGHQAYWVCPLIEESEALGSQAAQKLADELASALPDLSVGLIHGRMKPSAKDEAMCSFKGGRIDLLVATTVVEVGLDVPNATLMVIESAERMGLAQLHQLRGRVGRGDSASSCVLLYRPPLSAVARERLKIMRETNDGFRVAEKDLELRGPGEVLGTRQAGLPELKVAELVRDADLLPRVVEVSDRLLQSHPDRVGPLIRRWIGGTRDYGRV